MSATPKRQPKYSVPRSKWKYAKLGDNCPFNPPDTTFWGMCLSCGKVAVWEAGRYWRCHACGLDMPWLQQLPVLPWVRAPTTEEAVTYLENLSKRPSKRKP